MSDVDFEQLWEAFPNPALLLDGAGRVRHANGSAEDFLGLSNRILRGRQIRKMAGEDSRLADLIGRAGEAGRGLAEYNVDLSWPDAPVRRVDLSAVPVEGPGVLLSIFPRGAAERMDQSLTSRGAARSVVGMAAMLAHEIKNPLAGISGAAQLLGMGLGDEDRALTDLIREEVTRIEQLVDRVESFGETGLARRQPVNVHDVLDRAARAAKAGFARHVRFVEEYDPSLPPTPGDADQLMQVMQNLLKNAAEATPEVGGVIALRTSYRAGIKVRTATGSHESLPLQITVSDNGAGVPAELAGHIFEPFVTSKAKGSGLGLALVSKVVADHGGVISCDSQPGWTTFRLLMPVSVGTADMPAEAESAA